MASIDDEFKMRSKFREIEEELKLCWHQEINPDR